MQPRRTVGLTVAGSALLSQWVLHLVAPEAPFAPISLGDWVVRRAPGAIATFAIDTLGHRAMELLAVGTVVVALALGYLLGRLSPAAHAVIAGGATLGASALDPMAPRPSMAIAAAGLSAGVALAVSAALRHPTTTASSPELPDDLAAARRQRRALVASGLGMSVVAVTGVGLLRRVGRQVAAGAVRIDRRATRAASADFDRVRGLSPVVTSRADHYTVDIDLLDPGVDDGSWRLKIDGAVARSLSLSLDELRAMPTVERHATLSCISNPVGGDLVGSALWVGVPLADLLREAGTSGAARSVEALAVDGYSDTIPFTVAADPETIVAFGMNGGLLPRGHGFPARLRVPSRYGIKNVKWLRSLTVLAEDRPGYWEVRGWDGVAVVKTQSRIDVPRDGATVGPRVTVAGVAWAGSRRVTGVEASADDGRTWRPARLEAEGDPLAWRRWQADFDLPPGEHRLAVRAIDGTPTLQTADRRPPHPSGASGYHRITIKVRG